MDDETFERIVDEAVESLPNEFLDKLENVSVVTQDWPTPHQLQKIGRKGHQHILLFGLYEGVPQTRRRSYGIGGALPDKITIFKIPHLMVTRALVDLKKRVRSTVMHEIGHHFGMSEERIRKAEMNRRNRKSN